MGKPSAIQLVNYKDGVFELDVVALQSIVLREDVKNLPIVLYSVAGASRGGKSFLLNYFLRYLNSPVFKGEKDAKPLGDDAEALTGFSWRGGSDRHTIGLLMWSEPIIKTLENGDKVAILLLDTQGLFDDKTSMKDCSIIFALSTILSSLQIYNIKNNLQEDQLQFLQLFTQYAKLAEKDETKSFQNLLFLIRDWMYVETHPWGSKGGDELVAKRFELTKDLSTDMADLRKGILASFDKVSGFLLPHPGFKVLNPSFDGRLADLEEDFKKYLLELVTLIFSPANLTPKKINGEIITAKDLPTYFTVFLDLLKSNETPSVTSMTKAISDISLQTAENDAQEFYEKNMEAKFGVNPLSVPDTIIRSNHAEALVAAKASFTSKKKIGSAEETQSHLDKLEKELDRHLTQYLMMNESKLRKLITEANKVYSDTVKAVHGSNPLCLATSDLESLHEEALKKAIDYFSSRRQPLAANIEDPDKLALAEKLKKKLDDLNHENEENTRQIISDIMLTYGRVMETYLSKEYAAEDDDFLNEHKKAKQVALNTLRQKRNRKYEELDDSFMLQLMEKTNTKFRLLEKINKEHNRKAFKEAYDVYENSMQQVMNSDCCYSSEDLDSYHEQHKRTAMLYFHPHKSETNDYQKGLLTSKINSLYAEHCDTNKYRNRAAIRSALADYEWRMDDAIKPRYSWLLIVPMITSLASRYSYHEENKERAFRVFRSKRCWSSKYDHDEFYRSLDRLEDMWELNRTKTSNRSHSASELRLWPEPSTGL